MYEMNSALFKTNIGIVGGGQLGLMMQQAGFEWHLNPTYLDPDPEASVKPYGNVVQGSFRDYQTVLDFGADKDLISIEIEDVNLRALKELEALGKKVFPQPKVLEIIQNKWTQKNFLLENGFPTSEFIAWSLENKKAAINFLPAFWKQNTGGYDGKGVVKIETVKDLLTLLNLPGFLEKKVDLGKEIAVIVARNEQGEISTFPLVEQVFHPVANLVEYLQTPAQVSQSIEKECIGLAKSLAEKLEIVGLLAVELFVDKSGKVLVNEMAPRPHNSGHQTIEACFTSQFQQFWRAILNFPLGDTSMRHPFAAMVNLIGEPNFIGSPVYEGLEGCLKLSGVYIHLYGKVQTRPFRKMGHATVVASTLVELQQKVSFVKNHLKVIA